MSAATMATSDILRDSFDKLTNIQEQTNCNWSWDMSKTTLDDIHSIIIRELDLVENHAKSHLPGNPKMFNSSQAKIWISQFLRDVDFPLAEASDIQYKLDTCSYETINGATLYQWDANQWQQYFGTIGDIMSRAFHYLVENYQPECQDTDPPFTEKESLLMKQLEQVSNHVGPNIFEPILPDRLVNPDEIIPSPVNNFIPHEWTDISLYQSFSGNYPANMFPEHEMGTCVPDEICSWITPHERTNSVGESDTQSETGSVAFPMEPEYSETRCSTKLCAETKQTLPSFHCFTRANHPVAMVPPIVQQPPKRGRGRPRKERPIKQKRIQPILYKFILMHLNGEFGSSSSKYLEWVDKSEGIFRFHSAQKDAFAAEWGKYKRNREPMTYQNMARALRNYTKGRKRIMERVKRKLHYKFVAGVPLD